MDDIGSPVDPKAIEVWLQKQLFSGQSLKSIASTLVEKWDSNQLQNDAKQIVARFFVRANLFSPLIRMLKLDLLSGSALPWATVMDVLMQAGAKPLPENLVDALMTGASRDGEQHRLAAEALLNKDPDPRWSENLESALRIQFIHARAERDNLFKEIQLYKSKRMTKELYENLTKVLNIFPSDPEALSLLETVREAQFDWQVDRLKREYKEEKFLRLAEKELSEEGHIEISDALIKDLDSEQAYLFSVAFFQMGMTGKALNILRTHRERWQIKEKLWEVELLLSQKAFAEALNQAQIILNENRTEGTVVKASLYFSAKALHGLGDQEQASSILRGIIQIDPHFRDASVLLVEWKE